MIIISNHARFNDIGEPIHGTGSEISDVLIRKKIPFLFIKHSHFIYDIKFPSLVEEYRLSFGKHFVGIRIPFLPIRIVQEQLINLSFIIRNRSKLKLFIGIDPLNGFSGVVAKKMRLIKKFVFYTADYAHQRFKNRLLNWLYHHIDNLCITSADEVWNVSSRILKQREQQGVALERNFLVPNSPILRKIKVLPYSCINRHHLVAVVNPLAKARGYSVLIRAVYLLSKKYRKIRLLLIGSGGCEMALKRLVSRLNLAGYIFFLGRKTHSELLEILSKSAVGVALYTNEFSWTRFGDSMKIREYLACGLPVITTDVPSTSDEIKKYDAGFVIDINEEDLVEVIDSLLSNPKLYLKMRRNALRLARENDFNKVFWGRLKNLGIK